MQLLQRGRDTKSALNQACMDVYVRGQLSKVNKQVSMKGQLLITRVLQSSFQKRLGNLDSNIGSLAKGRMNIALRTNA